MRFRLVEEPIKQWPPTIATIDAYNKLETSDARRNFLKTYILPQKVFRHIFGIRPVVIDCILKYGLDPKRNKFLEFVTSLTIDMPDASTYKQKMLYVYNAWENKKLDLKLSVLNNASLYNRSYKDFQYTLNAFNTFSRKDKASLYFKNTKVVNINEFMNGDIIKPAGIDGREGDTIYNVIEKWASNGNEYSEDEIAERKQKEAEDEEKGTDKGKEDTPNRNTLTYAYLKEELKKALANKSRIGINMSAKDYLDYLERIFITFLPSKLSSINQDDANIVEKPGNSINDSDVAKFGKPASVDTPIFITSKVGDNQTPGIYIFHKFIPMDEQSMKQINKVSNFNLTLLKNKINNVTPSNDEDALSHLKELVSTIDRLQSLKL